MKHIEQMQKSVNIGNFVMACGIKMASRTLRYTGLLWQRGHRRRRFGRRRRRRQDHGWGAAARHGRARAFKWFQNVSKHPTANWKHVIWNDLNVFDMVVDMKVDMVVSWLLQYDNCIFGFLSINKLVDVDMIFIQESIVCIRLRAIWLLSLPAGKSSVLQSCKCRCCGKQPRRAIKMIKSKVEVTS